MDTEALNKIIRNKIIKGFINEYGLYYVPVAVSNRHVHLSSGDVEKLFGKGYKLKSIRPLSQPRQFVCEEKVTLVGTKGAISGIRVLGPERKETQVEISVTDSYQLGIEPVVRMSGDLKDTPGAKLIGPYGETEIPYGVIVSARHLHLSDEEAGWYGLKDGDVVKMRKTGLRDTVFSNIIVRAGSMHSLEVHLDTDEGNASSIKNGELLLIEKVETDCEIVNAISNPFYKKAGALFEAIKEEGVPKESVKQTKPQQEIYASIDRSGRELVTEEEIFRLAENGVSEINACEAIITPLALDRAREVGISVIYR